MKNCIDRDDKFSNGMLKTQPVKQSNSLFLYSGKIKTLVAVEINILHLNDYFYYYCRPLIANLF